MIKTPKRRSPHERDYTRAFTIYGLLHASVTIAECNEIEGWLRTTPEYLTYRYTVAELEQVQNTETHSVENHVRARVAAENAFRSRIIEAVKKVQHEREPAP